ncbi:MAG: VCBS repeat-containing protein [Planctomycetes bacterium]|nr:VCBS repeat-containing protein [Planctomycetota bacterium]MCC7172284.1 VCBS repeat-containing protein [Planctomycetota bacterium]
MIVRSFVSLVMFFAALALPTRALAGGTDDVSHASSLLILPAGPGGTSGIDLRTSVPFAPAVLLLDAGLTVVDPDGASWLPYVRVLGPNTIVLPVPTDANGRFRALAQVPNVPALSGQTVFMQALTLAPGGVPDVTNVAALTIAPGPGPSWADRTTSVPPAAQVTASHSAAAGDIDLDGDPDLVVATDAGVLMFRNDGVFSFGDVTASSVPFGAQVPTYRVELFDADADGDLDVFAGGAVGDPNNGPLPNVLLVNTGGFGFALDPSFPSTPGIPQDVVAADFDRDGDVDLMIANGKDTVHSQEQHAPNTLLVNQGFAQGGIAGKFVEDVAFTNAAWNVLGFANLGVASGDIDNDGDLDVLFARSDTNGSDGTPGQPNVLLRNDGNLAFADVSTQLTNGFSDNSRGARFGDLDGDGDLDLIVANSGVSILSAASGEYYRNDGVGNFTEDPASFPQIDESETAIRLGVQLVDVDLDGDLDVLEHCHEFFDFNFSTGQQTGGDDLLFLNLGGAQGGIHGTFALDPTYTSFGIFISTDAIFADFDLDGDDDVYVPSEGKLLMPTVAVDTMLENTRK